MPRKNEELKAECIRLRIEERMSLREIASATGVSKGSLSLWLGPFPLTEEEKKQRRSPHCHAPKKERRGPSKYYEMVNLSSLSRLDKAKIAEAAVLFRLILNGFVTFGSVFDGDKADWIVEVPGIERILKIQVRFARLPPSRSGLPTICLQCMDGHNRRRRYVEGEFDYIVGYDLYADTAYVYSAKEVSHLKHSVSVTEEHAERWDKLKNLGM